MTEEKVSFHLVHEDSVFYPSKVVAESGVTQEVIPFNVITSKGWIADWMDWLGFETEVALDNKVDQELLQLREKVIKG